MNHLPLKVAISPSAPSLQRAPASRVAYSLFGLLAAAFTYGSPIVLGLQSPDMQSYAAWSCVVIVIALSAVTMVVDPRLFLFYWINLAILQNALAGFWFGETAGSVPLAVTEAKTVAVLAAMPFCSNPLARMLRQSKWIGGGLLIYCLGLAISIRNWDIATAANLRNFVMPLAVLFVAFACGTKLSGPDRLWCLRSIASMTTVWLVAGTVGEVIFSTPVWRQTFHTDTLGGLNSLARTTSFLGLEFSRFGGFLFEPINAGYVASSIIVVIFLLRSEVRESRYTALMIVAGCSLVIALAATKNGLLMFLVAAVGIWLVRRQVHPSFVLGLSWFVAFFATLLYIASIKGSSYILGVFRDPIGLAGGESASIHMAGLVSGFQSLIDDPLGHGVGSGGNFLKVFKGPSPDGYLSTGAESALGTLAYQGGIASVLGFFILLLALASNLGGRSTVALAVWSAGALFSEAFFGPISLSVLVTAAGLLSQTPGDGLGPSLKDRRAGGVLKIPMAEGL